MLPSRWRDTIVVGYEGKEGSERVLDAAIAAVRESGGTLVVAVAEYMPVDPGMPSMVYDVSGAAVPLPDPDPQAPPPLQAIIDAREGSRSRPRA